MNKESIELTCNTRKLYRFSRKHNRVMLKGETSNNIQNVISVFTDCDSDALLITVDSVKPMCHNGNFSCFPLQTFTKANLKYLADSIAKQKGKTTYSGIMQDNPGFALQKILEELIEIMASNEENITLECADLLFHLIAFINGIKGTSIEDVLNELNSRKHSVTLVNKVISHKVVDPNVVTLGIAASKYSHKTDKYILDRLGVKIIRGEGRNMKVTFEIVDNNKYQQFFNNKKLEIVPLRPKDMGHMLTVKRLTHIVTYETVVGNFAEIYKSIDLIPDETISLCLIKRSEEIVDPTTWTETNKGLIIAEHPILVSRFLNKLGLNPNVYHIDRAIGSSESILVNNSKYHLCDAIVETGSTLVANNLEIQYTIMEKGKVMYGLYERKI